MQRDLVRCRGPRVLAYQDGMFWIVLACFADLRLPPHELGPSSLRTTDSAGACQHPAGGKQPCLVASGGQKLSPELCYALLEQLEHV